MAADFDLIAPLLHAEASPSDLYAASVMVTDGDGAVYQHLPINRDPNDFSPVPAPEIGNSLWRPQSLYLSNNRADITASIDSGGSGELIDFLMTVPNAGHNLEGDWDFYSFHLDRPTTLRAEVIAARLGGSLDPVLGLWRQGQTSQLWATDDDTVGRDPVIERNLQAGNYVICVAGAQGTTGDYRLLISAGIPPQIAQMTPDGDTRQSPQALTLFLSENNLAADSVLRDAFRLVALDSFDQIAADLTSQLGAPSYSAAQDRITLPVIGSLADGNYALLVGDTLVGLDGLALDGDGIGGAGGDFVGRFRVDTTAPQLVSGSLSLAGALAAPQQGLFYRVAGQATAARPGEHLRAELDLDGDGQYDDGYREFVMGDAATQFVIEATTPLAAGQGAVASVRLIDALGNPSSGAPLAIDANLALVTAATPDLTLTAIKIQFNRGDLLGIDQAGSYHVAGRSIRQVTLSADRRVATLQLDQLPDGVYAVTVFSGAEGVTAPTTSGAEPIEAPLDGDGDGAPGGDYVATVIVDRRGPLIHSLRLAGDDATPATNRTFDASPSFALALSDEFPGAQSWVTLDFDFDGDGQYDDQRATALLAASGAAQVVIVAADHVFSEQLQRVVVRATDASGNTALASLQFVVDQRGPIVRSTQVTLPQDELGLPAGIVEVRIALNEELDRAAVANLASYRLFGAGADGILDYNTSADRSAAIISATYLPGVPSQRVPPAITIVISAADLQGDQYQLVLRGDAIRDLAGNPLTGGDLRIPFQYHEAPPRALAARPARADANTAPNLVIVDFSPQALRQTDAANPANYRLERLGAAGGPIQILSVYYDPIIHRALLRAAAPLAPGDYRLTVFAPDRGLGVAGITSQTGVALDGDGNEIPGGHATFDFNVEQVLNALDIFPWLQNSLVHYATQATLDGIAQRKSFASSQFAEQLLRQLNFDTGGMTSAQIQQEAQNRLSRLLREQSLSISLAGADNHDEYLVIWSRDARFVLSEPADQPGQEPRIGRGANGWRVREISGAVLVEGLAGDVEIALAIVPVGSRRQLTSGALTTQNGAMMLPDLGFELELAGLAPTNQTGVMVVRQSGVMTTRRFSDVAAEPALHNLDIKFIASGYDPKIALINQHVRDGIEAIYGPLEEYAGTILFGWFDPVDYVLSDAQGQTGAIGGQAFHTVAGGFSASNGSTGLIVSPNSLGGPQRLELLGLGTGYSGAINFASGGVVDFVPLQGALGPGASLVAVIDFRSGPTQPGPGGPIGPGPVAGGPPSSFGVNQAAFTVANLFLSQRQNAAFNSLVLPLFGPLTSALGVGDGFGRLSALNMASHIGRQGVIRTALRQLRQAALLDLRSLRGGLVQGGADELLELLDRLIAQFSDADPAQFESFWRLEPHLQSLVERYGHRDEVQPFSRQLKFLRALHEAADRASEGPLPHEAKKPVTDAAGEEAAGRAAPASDNRVPMDAANSSTTTTSAAPGAAQPSAAAPTGDATHVDPS